ncbi:MAG: hypothetical protein R2731_20075 [Nocardioides sp.]
MAGHACGDTLRKICDAFRRRLRRRSRGVSVDAAGDRRHHGRAQLRRDDGESGPLQLLGVLPNRNVRSPLVPRRRRESRCSGAGLVAAGVL